MRPLAEGPRLRSRGVAHHGEPPPDGHALPRRVLPDGEPVEHTREHPALADAVERPLHVHRRDALRLRLLPLVALRSGAGQRRREYQQGDFWLPAPVLAAGFGPQHDILVRCRPQPRLAFLPLRASVGVYGRQHVVLCLHGYHDRLLVIVLVPTVQARGSDGAHQARRGRGAVRRPQGLEGRCECGMLLPAAGTSACSLTRRDLVKCSVGFAEAFRSG
mmetsp:Transcript_42171/g.131214  ORF Transcript_42171/g.131214 Transcript_42171/m.131214 type:complete len:218 (-) Transcript_42171:56-709(-)